MKSLFRYPGSKWSLADWIISFFPKGYERMVYLEPFLGSGAVFFNKRPGAVETINDLDGDVVNFFKVLRERPEELKRQLELTPYSREEYDRAFEPAEDEMERARRFAVRTTQAIGAKLNYKCGWRNHHDPKIGGTACRWAGVAGNIDAAATRLRGDTTHLVQIECMDAIRLVERYNRREVLMYVDPPYVLSTRKCGRMDRHEMDEDGHRELLNVLQHIKAHVILSGYDSDLYEENLSGWKKYTKESQITSGEKAEECLWLNYEPPCMQLDLFEELYG